MTSRKQAASREPAQLLDGLEDEATGGMEPSRVAPVPEPGAAAADAEFAHLNTRKRRTIAPYMLILPAILILLLALGYPVIWQLVTSTMKYGRAQVFGQPAEFVGFGNYANLLTDSYMWTVVFRSVAFCLIVATTTMVVGVLISLLMRSAPGWVRIVLQVALLLAWAMPVVAAMTIWSWIFDWRRGIANYILGTQGHNWLANPWSFFMVAGIIVVWMSVPFVAFSVYAGLTQVPNEVLEAASVDGATPTQQLARIIIPMIKPVLGIVFLLQIIWDLRVFTQIYMLQDQGSNPSDTNLLGTYIYQLGVGRGDFGTASAVSIFVLLLTIALSWAYVRYLMQEEEN